jgi:hypothetical protein
VHVFLSVAGNRAAAINHKGEALCWWVLVIARNIAGFAGL